MKILSGKFFRRIFPLLWCGLIFIMSAQADPPGAGFFDFIPNADKIAHAMIYAVLGFLAYEALRREDSAALRAWAAVITILFVAMYGASDEFHQHFVPGRKVDVFDWTADVAGAAAAVCARAVLLRRGS